MEEKFEKSGKQEDMEGKHSCGGRAIRIADNPDRRHYQKPRISLYRALHRK